MLIGLLIIKKTSKQFSGIIILFIGSAVVLVYLSMISSNFILQEYILTNHKYQWLFTTGHIFSAFFFLFIFGYIVRQIVKQKIKSQFLSTVFTWLSCIIFVIFVTVEANLLVRSLFFSKTNAIADLQKIYIKTVLPILWGLSSFAFMWAGMKFKFRPLRIFTLSLFTLTLLKLFVYDIQNIPVAGKIAAFFCLGILLLVVSFMYQRLKTVIINDDQNASL